MKGVTAESATRGQDTVLLKFLRAREFAVDKAFEMFQATVRWRKEFNVRSVMAEEFSEAFDKLGYIHKTDTRGARSRLSRGRQALTRAFARPSRHVQLLRLCQYG